MATFYKIYLLFNMNNPLTRNTSSVIEQLDIKFAEFKKEFAAELKSEFEEMKQIITEQRDTIMRMNDKLIQNESTIIVLQNSVSKLKENNELLKAKLENDIDQLESYSRRQCLRINGVEVVDGDESSEAVVKIVKTFLQEAEVTAPDNVIDRAHRIGRSFTVNGRKYRSIIVKFNNFRTRALFYKNRNKLDKKIRVRVDLTKRRYNMLKETLNIIDEKNLSNTYAFADINCRLKIVDKVSEEEIFFNTMEEAMCFLSQC